MLNLPEIADSTYSGVGVKLSERDEEQLILSFRGKIIANTTEDLARRVIGMCAREGWRPRVVLDFSQVRQIDSIGIGAICEIHSHASNHEAKVQISGAPASVAKILRLMSVDTFIDLV